MFADIGIIVFALIGIFTKKRWAAIVATIWLITSFIIGLTINSISGIYGSSDIYGSVEGTFEGSLWLLLCIEIILVLISWFLVIWKNPKKTQ